MQYTRLTKAFIGFMTLAAMATIGNAIFSGRNWHPYLALTLGLAAIATSRMKVTIPGINGNMSVNLPFLMLSVITLSAAESILIASVSTIVQTLPRDGSRLKPVRLLFNVSMMVFSCGAAGMLFQHQTVGGLNWTTALAESSATFFLGQTLPVSIIVALTDGGAFRRIWTSIAQMSFPYYVVSAGVTTMVNAVGNHIGLVAALMVVPVMYAIHRSYRQYFAQVVQAAAQPMAMAARAGAR